ncbi:NADH-quinone oxidoreductase subunit NuoI [Campylobacter sp. RM16187]|uniref:NADH-quinone oxidoreductase subunit NuoI n=1 Tax=Campylobacter sp. RM16187 TaxID=1660063 RepID=UPI0021B58AD0|nr:NADH-quinone oxidoreductase subunit NuoI [Campylobacter sp. RM16187]QKG29631.1 NADH:quinone oxidoreductase I, chain I [Campylobacter sp. RM16187]
MKDYIFIKTDDATISNIDKFKRLVRRTFKLELFKGLWIVLKEMIGGKSHTLLYPLEKMQLSPRYRAVHKLMRFIESENERCIGCGLCEKICVSNCIAMETKLDENGRKRVVNYSINYGRCVYCGLCADVCPEIAIVHGSEYENASEQRAYFGFKDDLLTPKDKLCEQVEFPGYGSLREDADKFVKATPNAYINIDEISNKPEKQSEISKESKDV